MTFKVLLGVFTGIYAILFLLMITSVMAFWQGRIFFQKLRKFIIYPAIVLTFFTIPLTFGFQVLIDCHDGNLRRFQNLTCFGNEMMVWSVLSIVCLVAHFGLTILVLHSMIVTAVGPRGCFFSIESQAFVMVCTLLFLSVGI